MSNSPRLLKSEGWLNEIVKSTTRAIKKKRWAYLIYCAMYIVFWILLLIAIIRNFYGTPFNWSHLSDTISIEAIQQIVKTIGFGSILLAWIYSALDKEELGFKYSELVQGMYSHYNYFLIGHLLAVLICVWLSEDTYWEGSVLAFAIILEGCIIHWKVLSNLMFRSKKRKSIAINEWGRIIEEEWANNKNRRIQDLFRIASVVPTNDGDCSQDMENVFTIALLKYSQDFIIYQDHRRSLLLEISRIWDHLLRGRSESDLTTILDDVLRACANADSNYLVSPVCAGYVLWLYNSCINSNDTPEQILPVLYQEIVSLCSRLREMDGSRVVQPLCSAYCMLYWFHFFCGTTKIDKRLLMGNVTLKSGDYDVLYAVARCVFQEDACKQYFDNAFRQIFVQQ